MTRANLTTEQLTDMWEDFRAVKNLMGKCVNAIVLNQDDTVFSKYWSSREDVSLGLNDGYYIGPSDISAYYEAICNKNKMIAKIMAENYPTECEGRSAEELYGVGTFRFKPIANPVIEVAHDGSTAKGLWYCQGNSAEVGTSGPISYWTWGYFATDFIKENEQWRIWHMLYLEDVNSPCGQSWGMPIQPYEEYPEWEPLRDFVLPQPTKNVTLREMYHPRRSFTETPRIPEPYVSFEDTFSYGA